jgi:multidrug efflux pump subunit AcrB
MKPTRYNDDHEGVIGWFTRNPVAANLLMAVIMLAGFMSYMNIQKRTFPEFEANLVQVVVPYRGAAPAEVEEGVIVKIEEAVADIEGIKEIRSVAREGSGLVQIEVLTGHDVTKVLDDVKLRVDAIPNFPAETEKPIISEVLFEQQVVWVTVYGQLDDRARKNLSRQVRDEIQALPGVRKVNMAGDRAFEMAIEVSEANLRKFALTFDEVAAAVRRSSIDMPGGSVKTDAGDILLRTKGQAYTGSEFADIVLRTNADGTRVRLADVAEIRDDFVESEDYALFEGQPSLSMSIIAVDGGDDIAISNAVNAYVEKKRAMLPEGAKLAVWGDTSFYLKDRLNMMVKNMLMGTLLVFACLALFLRLKLAFWVALGIPISFLGALWLMPMGPFAANINLISLFGFLLALGIIVDDAIIIGESVHTETQRRGNSIDNVIRGARKVAMPATFGVLTTMAVFIPMLFVEGGFSVFLISVCWVMVLCLGFSLVESKLILPAHLAGMKPLDPNPGPLARMQRRFGSWLERFIERRYRPAVTRAIANRGITLAIFLSTIILVFGILGGGLVRFVFFPDVPSDFIQANLRLADGSSVLSRDVALQRMQDGIAQVEADYRRDIDPEGSLLRNTLVFTNGDTGGQLVVELTKGESREWDAFQISERWRAHVGEIAGAKELRISASTNPGGRPIDIRLASENIDSLEKVSAELQTRLREYNGVYNIESTFDAGAQEVRMAIRPEAQALGLTQVDLGRQVRQAFFGEEAQRIQRGKDEIRVMIRYPLDERRSLADLEQLRVRTPDGGQVPFNTVAEATIDTGYSRINRINRKRSVRLLADIDTAITSAEEVVPNFRQTVLKDVLSRYPDVSETGGGSAAESASAQSQMNRALLIGLFLIYALLAVPLRSYAQPLIIMSVIPFGVVGAVLGHWIMGLNFSMMSMFGVVALAGVLTNDSLLMLHFINRARAEGMTVEEAVVQSGTQRFRAIWLTSLTTFFGLVPILAERSLQAQLIIPMATSLAFGIMFATVITLFLIPTLYLSLYNLRQRFRRHSGTAAASVPVGTV